MVVVYHKKDDIERMKVEDTIANRTEDREQILHKMQEMNLEARTVFRSIAKTVVRLDDEICFCVAEDTKNGNLSLGVFGRPVQDYGAMMHTDFRWPKVLSVEKNQNGLSNVLRSTNTLPLLRNMRDVSDWHDLEESEEDLSVDKLVELLKCIRRMIS